MKKLMTLLFIMFDLITFGQEVQTASQYVIPAAGQTITIPSYFMPDVIYINTGGTGVSLGSNTFTVTYSSLPPAGTHWTVIMDLSLLTYTGGSNITIFGRQVVVENPNTDTIILDCRVTPTDTLQENYVSSLVQLQQVNTPATFNKTVTFNGTVIANNLPTLSNPTGETTVMQRADTFYQGCYPWCITGNSGLSPANFLGTTDTVPLRFKVNNTPSGIIDDNLFNTAFGYLSLLSNTSGRGQTAYGVAALNTETSGLDNSAFGNDALFANTTGSYNSGISASALALTTTGSYNTGIGQTAGSINTTGTNNTYLGYNAQSGANSVFSIAIGSGTTSYSYAVTIGGVRSLYIPGMPSGLGYVLVDTSGSGNFQSRPISSVTGSTFSSVTGDSVNITTGKNTGNFAGTLANWTVIMPGSPQPFYTYNFSFLQAVTAFHISTRLSGGTVSAGIPIAATQYQTFGIYWDSNLSEWILSHD